MADQTQLQRLFISKDFSDYCWIEPPEIVVAQWVRMKYMFGCDSYGSASCPTDIISLDESRRFFEEYRLGTIFRFSRGFTDPEERDNRSRKLNRALIELEHSVCDAGYYKAFILLVDGCNLCRECAGGRASCRNKKMGRPHPEGLGVDISATVSKYGYSVEIPGDEEGKLNRYSILLIE